MRDSKIIGTVIPLPHFTVPDDVTTKALGSYSFISPLTGGGFNI